MTFIHFDGDGEWGEPVTLDERGIEDFPEIMPLVKSTWGTPDFIDCYKMIVLSDDYSDTTGYPDNVIKEMTFLYTLYRENLDIVNRIQLTKEQKFHLENEFAGSLYTH